MMSPEQTGRELPHSNILKSFTAKFTLTIEIVSCCALVFVLKLQVAPVAPVPQYLSSPLVYETGVTHGPPPRAPVANKFAVATWS